MSAGALVLVLLRVRCCSDGTAEGACLLNTLQPGTALVASGYCLYSSSCMFVLTIGAGTHGQTQQVALPILIAPICMCPVRHCALVVVRLDDAAARRVYIPTQT